MYNIIDNPLSIKLGDFGFIYVYDISKIKLLLLIEDKLLSLMRNMITISRCIIQNVLEYL